jgi:hypothetical protein
MGLLSVVSEVPAYEGDAKARGLAIVVKNSDEAWKDALERVLQGRREYVELARAASRFVWKKRNAAKAASQQLDALK